jgi:hypothetical protein
MAEQYRQYKERRKNYERRLRGGKNKKRIAEIKKRHKKDRTKHDPFGKQCESLVFHAKSIPCALSVSRTVRQQRKKPALLLGGLFATER